MHRLLSNQLARSRGHDDATILATLCELVDKTYAEFDADRARAERATSLMLQEVEEINTVREDALARLKAEQEKLEAALSNMAHGLAMFDLRQELVICNGQYIAMLGLTGAMPGDGHSELMARSCLADTRDGVLDRCRGSMVRGEKFECTICLLNGRVISSSYQPLEQGGWIEVHRDVTEQRKADERIHYLAMHDALTDLANRRTLSEVLAKECERVRRGGQMAVLCLDLDYFKGVNDTLGHGVGDSLLKSVSERLKRIVRSTDTIARLGGDEFAIVQVESDQPSGASQLAQRVIDVLTSPFEIDGHQITIGTSVGIAVSPSDGEDAGTLMRNADLALYRAKAEGRRTFRFFECGMDVAVRDRRNLEIALRRAVMCGEFELHFQPLVDLETNAVTACEALIRWNHPTRGRVPPDMFIPLAEEVGLISSIGDWVVHEACRVASGWPSDVGVAVNISPVQFRSASLLSSIRSALARSELAAERLEIEVTETVLLQDTERTLQILHELKTLGVRIALDDFGTGYSSLSYLRKFPFDKLKIDRSFVNDIGTDPNAGSIIKAVTELAACMGMRTTAEGVETQTQRRYLEALRCSEIQGYLISRPVPNDQLCPFIANRPESVNAA